DVRGGRRVDGREEDLRGGRQVSVRLVDRILRVERQGLERREIGGRGRRRAVDAVDRVDSSDQGRGLVDAEAVFLRGGQPRQRRLVGLADHHDLGVLEAFRQRGRSNRERARGVRRRQN